jgi:hypothetical protein
MTRTPAILAIDPGLITGIATLQMGEFRATELPFQEACRTIHGLCARWAGSLSVGWERFDITPGTHKLTRQPEAVQVIGVARYFAELHGCRVLPPFGQHTPDAADRARLQAIGWWVPGQDDAQSAACHLLRLLLADGTAPPGVVAKLAEARTGS